MARKKDNGSGGDTNAWMVTFSDLLTLLLTFFVLLLTMSSMDAKKFKRGFKLFSGALGPMGMGSKGPIMSKFTIIEPSDMQVKRFLHDEKAPKKNTKDIENVKEGIKKRKLGEQIKIAFERRGMILIFNEEVMYKPGSAEIHPSAVSVLKEMSSLLKDTSFSIRIEGHTDNVPIRTALYPSNWELSTARAVRVLETLVGFGEIPPERFSAAAYADTKPLYPNNTQSRRAKNRRVEFVLFNQ